MLRSKYKTNKLKLPRTSREDCIPFEGDVILAIIGIISGITFAVALLGPLGGSW